MRRSLMMPASITLFLTLLLVISLPPSSSLRGYAQPAELVVTRSEEQREFGEEETEQAKQLFRERCVRCHGIQGNGRGEMASHLSPRPTDLTSSFWFQSTNRKRIKRVIIGGGGAIGKSILMPANPDLRSKPKVVAALVEYIIKLAPRPTPK